MAAADTNSAATGVDAAGNSADGNSLMDDSEIDPVTGKPESNLGSGKIDPVTGKPVNASKTPAVFPDEEDNSDLPKPAPSPSPALESGTDQEAEPPLPGAAPAPTPEEEVQPEVLQPLPGAIATQQAGMALGEPANPALEDQYSEWDLAQVESPMFLNAAVDDFNQRPLMLTGNWSVKPHFSIGSYYDGNVFLSNNNNGQESDYVTRFAPGLTMRLGNDDSMFYLMADYSAGFNYYLIHPNQSTVDQNGRAQFQWTMPKTVVGVSLDASSNTGQDVDAGTRVRQNLYFAGLTTHYDFGEKTSFDASVDYTRSDFNGLISSSQWEGDLFFDYQYSPKTQLGIGGAVGYLMVPGSPHQLYEQANLRATYQATGKLTLTSELGMELREFQGGIGSTFTPVFILEGAWAARPGTSLTLSARRSIFASAILDDQDYTATSFDFSVKQKMTDYVDVSLSAGYVNSDYSATAAGVNAVREDNYYYVRPAIEWKALSWMSIGVFYEYSQDMSQGGDSNDFRRDRAGVDIAILF